MMDETILLGRFPLRSLNSSLSEACDKDVLEMELLLDEKNATSDVEAPEIMAFTIPVGINKVLWYTNKNGNSRN